MSNVKKCYEEIATLLEANKAKKISTMLPELMKLMESKSRGSTVRTDEHGNVTEIFCYYHKEWEVIADIPYGAKASSKTGLNTMCKQGVSNWTKQQRTKKQAEAGLLVQLADGSLAVEDIAQAQEAIAEEAKIIQPYVS